MSADSIVGDGLAQSPCDELRDECARLRAERDEARADALALAVERNNWQSMYHDAEAERDAARALLREARGWLPDVDWPSMKSLFGRIDAALAQEGLR